MHVELCLAHAVLQSLDRTFGIGVTWFEVPLCDTSQADVLPQQHVERGDNHALETVSDDEDMAEAIYDCANLLRRVPSEVAAHWYEGCIETSSAAKAHRVQDRGFV